MKTIFQQIANSIFLFTPQRFFWRKELLVAACFLFGVSIFWIGCKDPYDVKVQNSQKGVLVVEGFLNSGGVTSIKLSRSFGLGDTSRLKMESGASVVIESNNNAQYPLLEIDAGVYNSNLGLLDPSQQYRLHINAGGREYVSDYVGLQSTPPIDSVSWVRDGNGVTISATTHDPANASHYYRYDYEETWEKHAAFVANCLYDPATKAIGELVPGSLVYQCWKTYNSTNINLATSTTLQTDIIYQKPLVLISNADQKLSVRYSILVKQYVLSKEAYEFFQLMKKNSESLGTVFDPQPSQITGNIHAVNSSSEVIGFFYASSEQQKRIFIDATEVPDWGFRSTCGFDKIAPIDDSIQASVNRGLYPFFVDKAGFTILDYRVSEPVCFDCRVGGGSLTKPVFW